MFVMLHTSELSVLSMHCTENACTASCCLCRQMVWHAQACASRSQCATLPPNSSWLQCRPCSFTEPVAGLCGCTPADCVIVHIDLTQAAHHVQLVAGAVAIATLFLIILALRRQWQS